MVRFAVEFGTSQRGCSQTGEDNHIYLTVFDQNQIGSGNTTYQIVNQVKRDHVKAGHLDRRFDTTLLINASIIHIEEKLFHEANEAFEPDTSVC